MAGKSPKKSAKTSKTDHVLNLLGMSSANNAIEEPEKTSKTTASPSSHLPYPSEHLGTPILEVAHTNHEALSESIHQALQDSLEEELAAQEGSPTASSDPNTSFFSEVKSVSPTEVYMSTSDQKVDDFVPTEEGPGPSSVAAPAIDSSLSSMQSLSDGATLLNVMQILVEESIDRYAKMFDVCRCQHCMADIKALALTQLPAKYVVLEKSKEAAMMNFYRYRYESIITIELAKACNTVSLSPHHLEAK